VSATPTTQTKLNFRLQNLPDYAGRLPSRFYNRKMLQALITSKTRIKLMLKFFLNSSSTGYLRGLATEFGESTNAIRLELNRFEEAGLLCTSYEGNRKIFKANPYHPLFPDISSIVRKYVGLDEIIDQVVRHLGEPEAVFLTGNLALGIESNLIKIIIVGENIDLEYLEKLVVKAAKVISKQIHYTVFTSFEFNIQYPHLDQDKLLPVWKNTD
jgi:hypothetical protein